MQQIETEQHPYSFTRRAFLDVIWNRIEVVEFYPSNIHEGRIYPLPDCKDRLGRVKVALALNTLNTREKQAQSLIHEAIHIDRASWNLERMMRLLPSSRDAIRFTEEEVVMKAAQQFYADHKELAVLARDYFYRRREEFDR